MIRFKQIENNGKVKVNERCLLLDGRGMFMANIELSMSENECKELLQKHYEKIESCIELLSSKNKKEITQGKDVYKEIKSDLKNEHGYLSKSKSESNRMIAAFYRPSISEAYLSLTSPVNSRNIGEIISNLSSAQFYLKYYIS